jgi:predicted PurR-regulated permease PerM
VITEAPRTRPESWLAAVWTLLLRLIAIGVVAYVLWRLRVVIVVVLLSAMLAFTMAPVVDWLCRSPLLRWLKPDGRRGTATAIVFIALALLIVEVGRLIVTPLADEIHQFGTSWSSYQTTLEGWVKSFQAWFANLPPDVQEALRGLQFGDMLSKAGAQVQHLALTTLESSMFLVELVLIPVLAFSFLTESRPLKREFTSAVPRRRLRDWLYVLRQTGLILQSYAIGQLILALIAGAVVWLLLTLLGVKYALALAVVAAVTRVIPVIGPLLGGIPIVVLTAFQGTDKAIAVLIAFTLMHLVESKVVMPRVIGYRIQLHPAVVIIVLLIGAEFFGMWGMFLAAPVAAVVKAMFQYFVVRPRRGRPTRPRPPAPAPAKTESVKNEIEVGRPSIAGVGDHSRAH